MRTTRNRSLWLIPGWGDILNCPVEERIAKLRDPEVRAHMIERANSKEAGVFRRLGNFGRYVIGDTYSEANAGLKGRVVKEIAAERGREAFDTLVEICINDELKTILWPMPNDNDPDTWALRQEAWAEGDIMLGGSDAGAHLDRMAGAPFPTRFLGDMIRGRQLDGTKLVRFDNGLKPPAGIRLDPSQSPRGRDRPSYARFLSPGCYAFQIDGTSFSRLVVFNAVKGV